MGRNKSNLSANLIPLLAPLLPAVKGGKTINLDWLVNHQSIDSDSASITWLDQGHIIFSIPSTKVGQDQLIERINIKTLDKRILSPGTCPCVSPDGEWIAFVKGQDEERQLWVMDRHGFNQKKITHIKGGLFPSRFFTQYIWSLDGKQLVLLYKPKFDYANPKRISPPSQIDLIDVVTNQITCLARFENRVKDLSWIPMSHEILFTQERMGFEYQDNIDYELISALNVKTKKVRTLAKFNGWQQQLSPRASPDGKLIAFLYDPDSPLFDVTQNIGLIDNDGKSNHESPKITRLSQDVKFHLPTWSSGGDTIYAIRSFGGYRQIYSLDLGSAKMVQITFAAKSIQNFALSPNGSHLAWIDLNAHGALSIQVALSNGKQAKNLLIISSCPKGVALSEVREIEWTSVDYPVPMRGLLFMPNDYKKGESYPLIVDIHGGGRGASLILRQGGGLLTTTPLEWQVWTAKNYAVFVPEFRSSGSFGSLANTRDHLRNHDILFGDLRDIEAGVDELISQGIADKNRLAVIGHSAGARRANLLTTTSHRYQVIVSHEGWADDYIVAINQPQYTLFYPEMGGSPWEVKENYLKDSALIYVKGATTPTLFLMGNPKLGGIDLYQTVTTLFKRLTKEGVDTDYISYLDEGHVFINPENKKDSLQRAIEWIGNYLS